MGTAGRRAGHHMTQRCRSSAALCAALTRTQSPSPAHRHARVGAPERRSGREGAGRGRSGVEPGRHCARSRHGRCRLACLRMVWTAACWHVRRMQGPCQQWSAARGRAAAPCGGARCASCAAWRPPAPRRAAPDPQPLGALARREPVEEPGVLLAHALGPGPAWVRGVASEWGVGAKARAAAVRRHGAYRPARARTAAPCGWCRSQPVLRAYSYPHAAGLARRGRLLRKAADSQRPPQPSPSAVPTCWPSTAVPDCCGRTRRPQPRSAPAAAAATRHRPNRCPPAVCSAAAARAGTRPCSTIEATFGRRPRRGMKIRSWRRCECQQDARTPPARPAARPSAVCARLHTQSPRWPRCRAASPAAAPRLWTRARGLTEAA